VQFGAGFSAFGRKDVDVDPRPPMYVDSVAAPATNSAGLTHRQVLIIFSGLMLGMLLAALDQTIVATALPTITGELGGLNHLSWVVTAYLLAATVSTPMYGKLGDLFGRKRLFQVAIAVFLTGSVLCGLAQDLNQLIAFRALQGLGGGGLIVLAQAIIADVVSPRERGRYRGTSALCSGWPASPDRCSAASSPTTSRGGGCSTSTCRSGSWRCSSPAPCSRPDADAVIRASTTPDLWCWPRR
jgi:hypothetical protein